MRLTPENNTLLVGMSIQLVLSDVPEDTEPVVVTTSGITASITDNIVTVTATSAGNNTVTVTAGDAIAIAIVVVESIANFTALTADGSGTGNDANVFGRQYIMNNNLSRLNTLSESLSSVINMIKILSITNQATSLANLGLIIADLVILKRYIKRLTGSPITNQDK